MRQRFAELALAILLAAFGVGGSAVHAAQTSSADTQARLNRLEADVRAAEDIQAIKRLQRAYGYYLDKGMWEDLSVLFADDAVANYPAGVFVGRESIRRHLYLNVGAVKMGEVGLGPGRLYNHMNIQPVVHLGPGGGTAQNDQCTLTGANSSASVLGTTLTLNLALAFVPSFAGPKTVYQYAADAGANTGWVAASTWTVVIPPSQPSADTVSPNASSGAWRRSWGGSHPGTGWPRWRWPSRPR